MSYRLFYQYFPCDLSRAVNLDVGLLIDDLRAAYRHIARTRVDGYRLRLHLVSVGQFTALLYQTGGFVFTSFVLAFLDALSAALTSRETDKAKRAAFIAEAFKLHSDDIGHLPLHQQALAWGVSKKVDLVQLADNFMPFKWMSVK